VRTSLTGLAPSTTIACIEQDGVLHKPCSDVTCETIAGVGLTPVTVAIARRLPKFPHNWLTIRLADDTILESPEGNIILTRRGWIRVPVLKAGDVLVQFGSVEQTGTLWGDHRTWEMRTGRHDHRALRAGPWPVPGIVKVPGIEVVSVQTEKVDPRHVYRVRAPGNVIVANQFFWHLGVEG
jgi:hypothetical protein